jgi:hypothetical protein
MSAFCKHLEQIGVDLNLLWSKIYDLVIKSYLSVDGVICQALKKINGGSKNNCFELLGFDVLIDSDLKPWLLEVNFSPSFATDSPLDLHIKTNLISDTLNLVGIRKFDRKRDNLSKMKSKVKTMMRGKTNNGRTSKNQFLPGVF